MHQHFLTFSSQALSRHSRVSEKLKPQIWAGEYVSIASLLHDSPPPPNHTLSRFDGVKIVTLYCRRIILEYEGALYQVEVEVRPPMFSVAPKERNSHLTFNQWVQGFEVFMSMYLLAPRRPSHVHAMLMYIKTVRNLPQRGAAADWRSYDEAFVAHGEQLGLGRVLMATMDGRIGRSSCGFPTMRLLFKANATSLQVCQNASAIPSIRGKNAMILPVVTATAAKMCGGPHAAMRCNKAPHTRAGAGTMPSRSAAAGSRPPWFKK